MENIKLRVIDFTEYPGPRYQRQGDLSGEEFYVKKLNSAFTQAYREEKKLEVYLDGTAGYPSSFLDESFGELVYDFTLEIVKKRLLIITELNKKRKEKLENETFIQWEERRKRKETVVHTMTTERIYFIGNEGKLQAKTI